MIITFSIVESPAKWVENKLRAYHTTPAIVCIEIANNGSTQNCIV